MVIRVGINGFGRIGRIIFRTCTDHNDIEVVAINDPAVNSEYICYLIKFDSTHGKFVGELSHTPTAVIVRNKVIQVYNFKMPPMIPWDDAGVDYVIEASGMFASCEKAAGHLVNKKVKRVIVTSPSNDIPMIIAGVNDSTMPIDGRIISTASSTLYCLAPIMKVLEDNFGVAEGFVTSIHAMTPSLKPLDGLCIRGKHWRDNRGIHQNIIPASTGACRALSHVIPSMKDKICGTAFRVPIVNVSVLDISVRLSKSTDLFSVLAAAQKASKSNLQSIMKVSTEQIVSSDFIGDSHSCVIDASSCMELNPNFFKIICFYENEYSYACRVLETVFMCENIMMEPRVHFYKISCECVLCKKVEKMKYLGTTATSNRVSSRTKTPKYLANVRTSTAVIDATETIKTWTKCKTSATNAQVKTQVQSNVFEARSEELGNECSYKLDSKLEKVKKDFNKMANLTENLLKKSFSSRLKMCSAISVPPIKEDAESDDEIKRVTNTTTFTKIENNSIPNNPVKDIKEDKPTQHCKVIPQRNTRPPKRLIGKTTPDRAVDSIVTPKNKSYLPEKHRSKAVVNQKRKCVNNVNYELNNGFYTPQPDADIRNASSKQTFVINENTAPEVMLRENENVRYRLISELLSKELHKNITAETLSVLLQGDNNNLEGKIVTAVKAVINKFKELFPVQENTPKSALTYNQNIEDVTKNEPHIVLVGEENKPKSLAMFVDKDAEKTTKFLRSSITSTIENTAVKVVQEKQLNEFGDAVLDKDNKTETVKSYDKPNVSVEINTMDEHEHNKVVRATLGTKSAEVMKSNPGGDSLSNKSIYQSVINEFSNRIRGCQSNILTRDDKINVTDDSTVPMQHDDNEGSDKSSSEYLVTKDSGSDEHIGSLSPFRDSEGSINIAPVSEPNWNLQVRKTSSASKSAFTYGGREAKHKDIYDKLDSESDDTDDSHSIKEKKSNVISIPDITSSLDDFERLGKICQIIEISDDLSAQLFAPLDGNQENQLNNNQWSFKNLCDKIKLDEFCTTVFGNNKS